MVNKLFKKYILVLLVVLLGITSSVYATTSDSVSPSINISYASKASVSEGGSVSYVVTTTDNVGVVAYSVKTADISMRGFTATVSITKTSAFSRNIIFSNIKSTNSSKNKYFVINAGVSRDEFGNLSTQTVSSGFNIKTSDLTSPSIKISAASKFSIIEGGTVSYKVTTSDNVGVTAFGITKSDIYMKGFKANITITGTGLSRTIIFSNIKSTNSSINKYFVLNSGVSRDEFGNLSNKKISSGFNIKAISKTATKTTKVKISSVTETKTTSKTSTGTKTNIPLVVSYIDDLSKIGSINKENTTLVSWLKSEKADVEYVRSNNYVADGQVVTYLVDYYNGSTEKVSNAKFEITIPYKVEVQEIGKNGSINQNENSTVVTWSMDNIAPASYCRLIVKVKYTENSNLKLSNNISKIFYVSLKTTINNVDSYSYLRQIFVDKTEGKEGVMQSYLTSLDNTNKVRPEEEITRAEFAKMLVDAKIVEVSSNSEEYKTLKDYEEIPVYARDAVSALLKNSIMEAFSDGEFKPNNPILMEDAIEIIAKASLYMSNGKLVINNPVFLLNSAITGDDGELSPKTKYIMEAIRQNIIDKNEIDVDKYTLRGDAIKMINALTFRGPYEQNIPDSISKFSDLKEKSMYFYDIIGASNNYTYIYNDKLLQKITK